MDYFPPTFKVVAGVGSFLQVDSKKSRRLILSGPLSGPAEEVTASPVAWVYGGPEFGLPGVAVKSNHDYSNVKVQGDKAGSIV
jgi:hypothetical protein